MAAVEFMRQRRGAIEIARNPTSTAAEKSRALTALRGLVVICQHPYERDPYSGAGNCWCGRADASDLHAIIQV